MLDNQAEQFTQVDEQDTVIGPISRKEAHADKRIIHRGVGIFVVNDQLQMLFQRRSMLKDTNPGKWTYSAGGHVTFGDEYQMTSERELEEEQGLKLPVTFITKALMRMPNETEWLAFFSAKYDGSPVTPAADEVSEIAWVPLQQIGNFVETHQMAGTAIEELKIAGYL